MFSLRVTIKRIGDSLGFVIPKEVVERRGLRAGDSLEVRIIRKVNLREMFGAVRFSKSSQVLKDELRAEWGN